MILTRTVAPASEPISLDDAREWLAFESGVTEDDALISDLIKEARAYTERRTNHKLITQTWTASLDFDEIVDEIYVPLVPLISVTSIKTYDDDASETAVNSSNFQVRAGERPRIVLTSSGAWPADIRTYDGMLITCSVGYGATGASLPEDLLEAVRGLVLHRYTAKGLGVRETVSGQLIGIPHDLERTLKAYRVIPQ